MLVVVAVAVAAASRLELIALKSSYTSAELYTRCVGSVGVGRQEGSCRWPANSAATAGTRGNARCLLDEDRLARRWTAS